MKVEVYRNNTIYQITFERGKTTLPLKELGPTEIKGTRTEFKPDPEIFEEVVFDYQTLKSKTQRTGLFE